jgi:dUTP diphosphatase
MDAIKVMLLPNACEGNSAGAVTPHAQITLLAAVPKEKPITIESGERVALPTGIAVELPEGWEGQIMPLTTLAIETGVTVLNSPGTIDPDYRGEVMVILINLGTHPVIIHRGTAIATMKLAPFTSVTVVLTESLTGSIRSKRGLGSTGR